jgi:Arc/MetJ family transcription regulator
MTVFAQDMSYYTNEYMRQDGTFDDRLIVLEAVRNAGLTGIGEFYHEALKYLIFRMSDIKTTTEQDTAEKSAVLLCQALGVEKYAAAAPEIWFIADYFDVARIANDGTTMQAALIAMGQVNGVDYLSAIVQRLNEFNAQTFRDEAKFRIQMAVVGCISAIEAIKDISGYSPVFFVYTGSYDPSVQQIAYNALPNIAEDPGEVISAIIQDPPNNPYVIYEAWNEMLRTRAPESSKARVASVALARSYNYSTTNRSYLATLKDMRKSAIDIIRQYGAADNSVYEYMNTAYSTNFNSRDPDYDEMMITLNALAALKSDEAVALLHNYLREVHDRRRTGPWGDKERRIFQWVISCIEFTGTKSEDVRILLSIIQRTADYTPFEQGLARNALAKLF